LIHFYKRDAPTHQLRPWPRQDEGGGVGDSEV